jgi:hypothetical protein
MPSLSFLQPQGITVGNFNMACNFHIYAAFQIMTKYNFHILAIQEHTSWNRELSEGEIKSIQKHSDTLGYFSTITKMQILIMDKRLWACHRNTSSMEDGRIITSRYAITREQHATFIAVYGVPHHGGEKTQFVNRDLEENTKYYSTKNEVPTKYYQATITVCREE